MNKQSFEFSELDDLYQDIILDHYRSPRNQKSLDSTDIETEGFNPFCGDRVVLGMKLDHGTIQQVSLEGAGCSISQASASILSELIKGKDLSKARNLYSILRSMMHGENISDQEMEELGEAEALAGVRKFPIRIKCALLSCVALEDGIKKNLKI